MTEKKNSPNIKKTSTLNVLYVANFHPSSVGEPEIAKALKRLGHSVDCLEDSQYHADDLNRIIKDGNYDFLLFAKLKIGNAREVKEFIEQCSIPTVCWLFDLYWGYRTRAQISDKPAPSFAADIVFTTDGGHKEMWKKSGINHHLLRQGAEVDEMYFGKPEFNTEVEIIFLGTRMSWLEWQYRPQLIKKLKDRYGSRFAHLGENGRIRHQELNNLLATTKIVIGDSVYSPHYWSNRVYEMLGKGGFLITPDVPGLQEEFEYYKHFIPYTIGDFDGLFKKIDYFLEKSEKRKEIQEEALKHMKQKHTYDHRVGDLLKALKKEKII